MTFATIRLSAWLGWRNLWRNSRRSAITALGIGSALAILMTLIGMLGGVREQLLRNGTELILGHVQIHSQDYRPDRHVADTLAVDDLEAWLARLTAHPGVLDASPRVYVDGLVATEQASAGSRLIGVDPAREPRVTTLLHDIDGASLGGHGLILGVGLAREIGASVGDEVAVVCQAADGSLGNELFTVVGVVRTGLPGMDRTLAVAHIADVQRLVALDAHEAHEVALRVDAPMVADDVAADLQVAGLLPETARVEPWGALAPQLREYAQLVEGVSGILILIMALFAGFGVLNSMMMAVFERTREFGMLNALGTSPGLVLCSLVTEALLLCAFGLAGGFALGAGVTQHMVVRGWDLTRWTGELSMLGTRLDPVWRAVWQWEQIGWAAAGLTVATAIAVLIPAVRILQLRPVEAMAAPTEV